MTDTTTNNNKHNNNNSNNNNSNHDLVTNATPTIPLHIARSLVSRINNHVHMMLRDSRVVVVDPQQQHEAKLGLFTRNELQLGKLVGTGGFSQVYQVTGFNNHSSSRYYTAEQEETRRRIQENPNKYVVKHLKKPTTRHDDEFCILAADLCVEAQFLASLQHENILSIRAWSAGGLEGYHQGHFDGYFILLDRLVETLEKRLDGRWGETSLLSRTKVAHQIASALEYLHEKDIVFRDLKPDNVGFDNEGTVKLFDFGLARELPQASSSTNAVYKMSGEIGTVRYMAPEVALCKEYNAKVDVYSWAVLYWQCLTLEKPYGDMARASHLSLVCRLGQRPNLAEHWPESMQHVLERAWAPSVYFRAEMKEVCSCLERVERDLTYSSSSGLGGSSRSILRSFTHDSSNSLVSMVAA